MGSAPSAPGRDHPVTFADRSDAGIQLSRALREGTWIAPIVLGLPRGGVPVAAPVAAALGAPLDVLVARKVGAPGQPELGIGAVAEGGGEPMWTALADRLVPDPDERAALVAAERDEIDRRVATYRGGRALGSLAGRDVVVVDDGLATGVTAEAALRAVAAHRPATLTLAVPVGAPDTVERLRPLASEVVCLLTPPDLGAVGAWYRDFRQTPHREVLGLLDQLRRRAAPSPEPRLATGAGHVPAPEGRGRAPVRGPRLSGRRRGAP